MIRMAEMQDLKEISALESLCFPAVEAAPEQVIRERIAAFHNHFFVMTEENHIIGFINGLVSESAILYDEMYENADLHDENGSYQMILSLAVSPDARHKGYGKALLRHMLETARHQHRKGVTLTCKEHLVSFYEESGFVSQGRSASTHGGFTWYEMRMMF